MKLSIDKMKTKLIIGILLSLLMVFSMVPMVANAEQQTIEVEIEIEVDVQGSELAKDKEFSFVMTPEDPTNPMPEDGGKITVKGSGKDVFGPIIYNTVGEYSYTIKAEPTDIPNCTIDNTLYEVNVLVSEDTNGKWVGNVVVNKKGETEKVSAIAFTNRYGVFDEDQPPKDDEDENPNPPEEENETPNPPEEDHETPKEEHEQPNTGDNTNIGIWVTLAAISVAIIILAVANKSRTMK